MPEEEAFAVLVQIMQQHRMRDMFKPSMAELGKKHIQEKETGKPRVIAGSSFVISMKF